MKLVVIGGSGLIGSKVVAKLRQMGHQVVAGAPSTGVNSVTGEGLLKALEGAQVVLDLSNPPSFADQDVLAFFQASGRKLAAAEGIAGVKHHIALSVVGTERLLDSGYFRGKMAQEEIIKASQIPYTIVRSTQFFEFLAGIAHSSTVGDIVRLSPADIQPIAADDIAALVANTALAEPVNGMFEVAGPQRVGLADAVQRYFSATGDPRKVVPDPSAPYFGVLLNKHALTPGKNPQLGTTSLAAWLGKIQA